MPEALWAAFAVGNLAWMVLVPGWSMLPYHLTWASLLVLYGLGVRTWSRRLMWLLVAPVMTATGLLFIDPAIRGLQPYDEVIELPMMVLLLFILTRHTRHRQAAMERLDALSRHNALLLERQRAFVQNASHALRTPITIALAHTELLAPVLEGTGAAEDVAVVLDELGRLRTGVDELLTLATAEQGDALRLAPVCLRDLLEGILRRWEPVPRRWAASIEPDVMVPADPASLTTALDAVLDNAVRFTGEGQRIELTALMCGGEAVITVADSGPGIPEDQLESVFERFETSAVLAGGGRNFGLGLAIVRAVVAAHGGRVSAAPAAIGGAAITLRIPTAAPAALPAAPAGTALSLGLDPQLA